LDWVAFVALLVATVALALLELFFLPLRFDGTLLPNWGARPFPVTVLLALVTMPLLVNWAADVANRVLVAGAPLWVWLITIGVVGVVGPENMVLLQDWRTLLLLGCGAFPAAIALGNALAARISAKAPSSGSGGAGEHQGGRTG
jgi:hypothetical protein